MKFCISFGNFELKYLFYCTLLLIIQIYIFLFINDNGNKLISDHFLLKLFFMLLGYLLNFIPLLISHKISKSKEKTNKLIEENTQSIEYIYITSHTKNIYQKKIC